MNQHGSEKGMRTGVDDGEIKKRTDWMVRLLAQHPETDFGSFRIIITQIEREPCSRLISSSLLHGKIESSVMRMAAAHSQSCEYLTQTQRFYAGHVITQINPEKGVSPAASHCLQRKVL